MNTQLNIKRGGAFALAKILTAFAVIAVAAALLLPQVASAGQQTQTATNTASLAFITTNTYAIYNDISGNFTNGANFAVPYIDGSKSTALFCGVGGYFTNTTAAASNITFRIATSIDGNNWTNPAIVATVSVPALSTNWAQGQFVINPCNPLYAIRTIENTNLAGVTGQGNTMYFRVYSKTGL